MKMAKQVPCAVHEKMIIMGTLLFHCCLAVADEAGETSPMSSGSDVEDGKSMLPNVAAKAVALIFIMLLAIIACCICNYIGQRLTQLGSSAKGSVQRGSGVYKESVDKLSRSFKQVAKITTLPTSGVDASLAAATASAEHVEDLESDSGTPLPEQVTSSNLFLDEPKLSTVLP